MLPHLCLLFARIIGAVIVASGLAWLQEEAGISVFL